LKTTSQKVVVFEGSFIFDRPEVAKLRGLSGSDPREKSEEIGDRYEERISEEPGPGR
jgi:hypothetical protein